jgi:hypothetical protein
MKAKVWVETSQEVSVEISGLDAATAILEGAEDRSPEELVRMACNNFLTTMRNIPDEAIAKQSPHARKIIAAELEVLLGRFR